MLVMFIYIISNTYISNFLTDVMVALRHRRVAGPRGGRVAAARGAGGRGPAPEVRRRQAAGRGFAAVVRRLLLAGGRQERGNRQGLTPLLTAAEPLVRRGVGLASRAGTCRKIDENG